MSLTGNLEDLPLLDILQIVSFSKKSGYLSIRAAGGEGGIVFREGLVVSAFTWDETPLDPRFASLPDESRERVVRTRIEIALEQLIRLREGKFSFNLTTMPPSVLGSRDLSRETLPGGINPQELLLELARGIDEDRRDTAAAVEASFAEPEAASREIQQGAAAFKRGDTVPIEKPALPPASPGEVHAEPPPSVSATPSAAIPSPFDAAATPPFGTGLPLVPMPSTALPRPPPAAPAGAPRAKATVLLVDDEDDVRRMLGDLFVEAGYQVVEAHDPESAVKKGGRLGKEAIPFLLVADLGMPTSGGSSFQGGFEVVKRLWKMHIRPPVLMMTERMNASIQLRAKQMGIADLVFKPGLSKLNPEQFEADVRAFGGKLLRDVLPRLARSGSPPPAKPAAASPPRPEPAAPTAEELTRQLQMLQQRLAELRQPGDANKVAILLMKVAREFFERGILFLVKNEEARGLAAFGPAPRDQNINLLVREIVIPLGEPSAFLDAVEAAKPLHGAPAEDKWTKHLMGKIGRFQSSGAVLLPVITHRETIAILFADNAETGREFGRLDALELFVNQAGIALENAFLQKRIQALQSKA